MSALEIARKILPEKLLTGRNLVLFEDNRTAVDLFPLSVLRPSWDIRCGLGCLRQWITGLKLPGLSVIFRPRTNQEGMTRLLSGLDDDQPDFETETIFLNGRILGLWTTDSHDEDLPETIVDDEGRVLIARRRGTTAKSLLENPGNELAQQLVQQSRGEVLPSNWILRYVRHIWDYTRYNSEIIERQLTSGHRAIPELLEAHTLRELPAGVQVTDRAAGHPVWIGAGVKIMPGVVLGNHTGPIWIGNHTEIEPHTFLEGPLIIGSHCRVKAGTKLYPNCSLGPHCRVAGEISATIMQGFVNKQHEGFVGNSIFGQWVNLGADTVTSNLKNDYSHIKVQIGGRRIDTGEQLIGTMCGDHTKTGINTMLNTGTVIGIAANVYGSGYPPRYIHSFAWGGAEGFKRGDWERTLKTARIAMARRNQSMSVEEERLLHEHYAEMLNQETTS